MTYRMSVRDAIRSMQVQREALERAYLKSDRYLADALEWVADHGHTDSRVVAVAEAAYRDSPQYRTVIDDATNGEQTW
jgi:hypothetical protein